MDNHKVYFTVWYIGAKDLLNAFVTPDGISRWKTKKDAKKAIANDGLLGTGYFIWPYGSNPVITEYHTMYFGGVK